MVGDASLFHRSDMVEAAWEAAAPILEAWNNNPPTDFPNYAAGTWGPDAEDEEGTVSTKTRESPHRRSSGDSVRV